MPFWTSETTRKEANDPSLMPPLPVDSFAYYSAYTWACTRPHFTQDQSCKCQASRTFNRAAVIASSGQVKEVAE
jgi:hypothetical protein